MDLSDKDPSENQNSPKWDRTSVSQAAARGTGWSLEGTEGPSCRKASHPAKGDTTMHGAGETESAKPPRPTGTRGRPATTPVRGGGRGARSLSSGASPRRPRPRTAAERGWAQGQSCLLRGRAPPLKESPEPSPAWVRRSFTKRVKNTRLSERHKLELPGTAVCCEGAGRPPSPRGDSGGRHFTSCGGTGGRTASRAERAGTSAPRASCLCLLARPAASPSSPPVVTSSLCIWGHVFKRRPRPSPNKPCPGRPGTWVQLRASLSD